MAKSASAKPNRQDSTLRNVRAANRKIAALEHRVDALEAQVHTAWSIKAQLENVDARLTALERKDEAR